MLNCVQTVLPECQFGIEESGDWMVYQTDTQRHLRALEKLAVGSVRVETTLLGSLMVLV